MAKYPWGNPYIRNSKGCLLANFKPGRGNFYDDGFAYTAKVMSFFPNDYGLYNMAGNVSEWVQDVYRPLSFQTFDDLNPVRRDGFLDKASGTEAESNFYNNVDRNPESFTSLITDRARVYKGGSWKDVAYWMSPGTRRYLDQDSATATIGFRCAMIRAGSNN